MTDAEPQRARLALAMRALPCGLLIAVAAIQIGLTRTVGLSPWAGGGFGMFAATDAAGTRHLHTFAIRPGLRREIPRRMLPDSEVEQALAFPSARNLGRVANAARAVPTNDHGSVAAVEVQVWHTRYDPDSRTPASRLLRAITVPFGGD